MYTRVWYFNTLSMEVLCVYKSMVFYYPVHGGVVYIQEYGIIIPCPWRCCVSTRAWYFNTLSMEVLCIYKSMVF